MTATDLPPKIEEALKLSLSTLHDAGIECMIGGGLAAWAQGGPPSTRDVDLMVRADDARRAAEALAAAGMETEEPPEHWLLKAYHDGVLIDLIHAPVGVPVDDELFARAVALDVVAMRTRVMALEDLFTTTLLALNDNDLDYGPPLKMARAVREKVDWTAVRSRTGESAYARGFFALAAELGLAELAEPR